MNMPAEPEVKPTRTGNPNYKLGSIYVDGAPMSEFKTDTLTYNMTVASDTSKIRLNISAYASTTTIKVGEQSSKGTFAGDVNIMSGDNAIKINSTAEVRTVRVYTKNVHRDCEVVYGDINGDGTVNAIDRGYMVSHMIKKYTLSESAFEAADINGDGAVNSIDYGYMVAYSLKRIDRIPQR